MISALSLSSTLLIIKCQEQYKHRAMHKLCCLKSISNIHFQTVICSYITIYETVMYYITTLFILHLNFKSLISTFSRPTLCMKLAKSRD